MVIVFACEGEASGEPGADSTDREGDEGIASPLAVWGLFFCGVLGLGLGLVF